MSEPILTVTGLDVHYDASYILQKIDFQLDKGLATGIGRNGMGKTTFIKALMGLAPITAGSIQFKGQELVGKKPNEIAQMGIGYCPQGRMIFSSLTVDEQLRFVHRNNDKKTSGVWNAEKVYELFPRLKERAGQSGTSLSGGEQQMLAIGRALTTNPSLLLMDEPSEGLAPVILERLVLFIDEILQSGVSLLLVEQNLPFVKKITDDVNVMMTGKFAYTGSLAALFADKALTQKLLVTGG